MIWDHWSTWFCHLRPLRVALPSQFVSPTTCRAPHVPAEGFSRAPQLPAGSGATWAISSTVGEALETLELRGKLPLSPGFGHHLATIWSNHVYWPMFSDFHRDSLTIPRWPKQHPLATDPTGDLRLGPSNVYTIQQAIGIAWAPNWWGGISSNCFFPIEK